MPWLKVILARIIRQTLQMPLKKTTAGLEKYILLFSLKMVQKRGHLQMDPHPSLKLGTTTGSRSTLSREKKN
jgi:hypothetical protein